MLRATMVGFDGMVRTYRSDDDGTRRMDELFAGLAGGRGYEVEVSPVVGVGGVFGAELYVGWTLADEARERSTGRDDQVVTYRLLPEM